MFKPNGILQVITPDLKDRASEDLKNIRIENWGATLLDSDIHGNPDCPAPLFMEAVKMPQPTISREQVARV